jgi:hypothetical protein
MPRESLIPQAPARLECLRRGCNSSPAPPLPVPAPPETASPIVAVSTTFTRLCGLGCTTLVGGRAMTSGRPDGRGNHVPIAQESARKAELEMIFESFEAPVLRLSKLAPARRI